MMRRDGHLAYAPNLQTASGADLGAQLGEALGNSSVFCENDANCAALAEHEWGAGHGISDFVMVTLGTGIGGGIVADGQLVRGRSGFAGEIGHMVVEAHGAPCLCGGRGCWERYASGGGLHRLTREAALDGRLATLVERSDGDPRAVRAEDVTEAAAEGLEEAVALMREVGWWLALGLSNLAVILDSGHFVIGGGLSEASDLVLPAAREYLVELVEGYDARPTITVTTSMFGARSGAMGARSWPLRECETRRLTADVSKQRRPSAGLRRARATRGHRWRLRLRPHVSHRLTRTSDSRADARAGGRRVTPAAHRGHPDRARHARQHGATG
jgi:glucokinase